MMNKKIFKCTKNSKTIKNPTPEGPDLVPPRRGYSALPPEKARYVILPKLLLI